MAGESARDVAQKRRLKAERLNRVADAYERGADGEERTAQALAMLPASGWFVMHDVRWPGKRFANIDHVVVGPGGVFVIDSKAWSGRVEVRNDVLRQNGRQREGAVAAAAEAALGVAGVLRVDPILVKPVLCFVGNTGIEGWARDVMLSTPENLVTMLLSRPAVVASRTVSQLLLGLQLGLDSARRDTSASPATPLRRSLARRSRPTTARRGRRPLATLLMFLGTVVAVLVCSRLLVSHADDVGQGIVGLGTTDRAAAEHRLGQKVTLPPSLHRPRLQITANQARNVHRVGATPYLFDGNRFFGVRLTIHNGGKQPWVSEPGTSYSVTDTSDIPHAGGTAIHIREGQILTDPIRIPAGGTVQGYVVFQVPAHQPLTGVSVTVGPGKPSTATWVIERQ